MRLRTFNVSSLKTPCSSTALCRDQRQLPCIIRSGMERNSPWAASACFSLGVQQNKRRRFANVPARKTHKMGLKCSLYAADMKEL
jgi:hypothetical protein